MASVLTFNQLVEVFKDIAQRHFQVNSFFLGRNSELENQKEDVIYPVLQVWPESSRFPQNQYNEYKIQEIDLKIRILDLVFQGEENEKDVHSDTLQIAKDIINEINRHPYYVHSNVQVIGDINLIAQEEQGTDFTAGWEFTLTIKILNYNSFCGLPFEGIDDYSVGGPDFTAVTYNAQYLTCATVTGCTTLQDYITNAVAAGGQTTHIHNGLNTYTGGTANDPTVNISGLTVDNLTVSGVTSLNSVSATTFSVGTIYSGSTNLSNIFLNKSGLTENTFMLNSMSSGLISGCSISINTGNTAQIDITPGSLIIVDNWTNLNAPLVYNVYFSGVTGQSLTYLSSSTISHLSISNSGTLLQFPTEEGNSQRRDSVMFGQINHPSFVSINNVNPQVDCIQSPISQFRDLMNSLRFINEGNVISANGVNLFINKSSGVLFGQGIGFQTNNKNPHIKTYSASTIQQFLYRTQTGGTTTLVTTIDPTKYDLNGVITTIGGTARATNQRVFLYPNGTIIIQYGQQYYANLTQAIAGLQTENFVKFTNVASDAILIGIISMQQNCTDLTNTSRAVFFAISKFGEVAGAAAGVPTTTLQQAYDNSVQPQILTSSIGAVQIKNGNGSNINSIFEGLDSGGTITSYITGDGNLNATTLSANSLYVSSGTTILNGTGTTTGSTLVIKNSTGGTNVNILDNGDVILKSNSVSGLSIWNHTGTTPQVSFNTVNKRIGLNNQSPQSELHIGIGGDSLTHNIQLSYNSFIGANTQINTSIATGGGTPAAGTGWYRPFDSGGISSLFNTLLGGGIKYRGDFHLFDYNTNPYTVASAETNFFKITNPTKTNWPTGNITSQRFVYLTSPSIGFIGASTAKTVSTFAIGAPIASTNAKFLKSSALLIESVNVGTGVTDSYGAFINASSGATNNWAAGFSGRTIFTEGNGNVTIGQIAANYSTIWMGKSSPGGSNYTILTNSTGSEVTIQGESNVTLSYNQGNQSFILDSAAVTFSDTLNISVGTTTGTKIGVSTSQKLSFWNTTPITQPVSGTSINKVLTNTGLLQSGGTTAYFDLPINLKAYTVATLPTGIIGDIAYVTDALAPTYLVAIVGGGTVVTPVFYNGTNWVAH